jgi:hypothetical protein
LVKAEAVDDEGDFCDAAVSIGLEDEIEVILDGIFANYSLSLLGCSLVQTHSRFYIILIAQIK